MPGHLKMEEKYLAIVLLDLIGSTAFVQKAGAKRAAIWLQYHDRMARNLIYKFQGREIDRSDGFLLSFDTLVDAVNFALQYQKEIPPKIKLNTRIGIHWGLIVEVMQDDVFVGAGAKRVELEGISKNISARTMSLCRAGQVLLTKEAMQEMKYRGGNMFTPKEMRYACVGLYKFKGVTDPQEIFAVGVSVESLQPPLGSEKVKRMGGPKYIKKKARDRAFLDWCWWLTFRSGVVMCIYLLYTFYPVILDPSKRWFLGLPREIPILDFIISLFISIIYFLK